MMGTIDKNLQVPKLRPLPQKDNAESFIKANAKKMKKKKGKAQPLIAPPQSFSGSCYWNDFRANKGSDDPTDKSQEVGFSEGYEEIQCLSLEDMKVYKKFIPRAVSPLRELWKKDDFPGLQNAGAGGNAKGLCSCQRRPKGDSACQRSVARVSTYCQTEDWQYRVDISSSTPDGILCRKVPEELRGTVMNIISLNRDNQSVIALLSCLLHTFMVSILHTSETSQVLSASQVRHIETILSREVKGLATFSSRSVRGQNRLHDINNCFSDLFRRYPGLESLPGFSDLNNGAQ